MTIYQYFLRSIVIAGSFSAPVLSLAEASQSNLDLTLKKLIDFHQLKGEPQLAIPKVDIKSPMAQLGKRLFFSPTLSGNNDIACVTCHHPVLGGSDKLPLPVGIDAIDPDKIGPGREQSPKSPEFDGGPNVPRNSLSTFNTVFYSRCMFWDCRVEALGAAPGKNGLDHTTMRTPDTSMGMSRIRAKNLLEAQAAFPVTSNEEMRGFFLDGEDNGLLRRTLAKRFADNPKQWLEDFRKAFEKPKAGKEIITFENIVTAIAAYEASQVFVDNPWKDYVNGDLSALSEDAKKGALLFFQSPSQGGYGCAACHSGDFFTDESFHVTAMPQIGRGKDDGEHEDNDFGRFILSGDPVHKFAFRTPTLLNVEVTTPYGHAGAYKSLRSTIRHMINPQQALLKYDYSLKQLDMKIQNSNAKKNTKEALKQLNHLQANGKSKLKSQPINEKHVDQLLEFLLTLTDPCTKQASCLIDWFLIK
ncbi:cytochrome-c peroxidase [Pseudobacteriovorax antillogorgiicola]|uniref:Cytochrome c peroxidase n=1 Tax=Pseudobacteriovorax antillogorgiicola TaxID=1513793 RepID=A0A1Y6CQK3_9BACT|nr:cytochrome c peroxidase [Pseudobacteriovorax antillogorgiicola]TCS42746.1 cytochrome c peroxidase [Pseudobacteriovorax antillogorgiicola]SMF82228.1 cytochrome c peroxidase [Pseudobacteriovorax antillogorgiicola]